MSLRSQRSPSYNNRYSADAFEPLNQANPADATINIPLDDIHHTNSQHAQFADGNSHGNSGKEKLSRFRGKRRSLNNSTHKTGKIGYDGEPDTINKMGMFYDMLLKSSIIVRYLIYILPLGICFAIPMIIGATVAPDATIGLVRIVWLFMWLLISWVGLWVSKLFAHCLPGIFQFFAGIVSSGTRKYALILSALEIQISLTGWALVSLVTFKPIMTTNPDTKRLGTPTQEWENIVQQILAAILCVNIIWLGERVLIQVVSINYHRKQFALRIRESKDRVQQLTALYESSRTMFPAFCPEFAEEDSIISDTIDMILTRKKGHKRSGSSTPGRVLRDVGRFGDKLTTAFGNVAHEITGKQVFNPNSPHSIVVEALEKNRASEALARRLWLSFVVEGHEALYIEDIIEVFGEHRREEAEACFHALDVDGNGDVSLDEMIQTVTEVGRERRAVSNSMHDVDQAINVLDRMLCVIVFIAGIFVFIAFLNKSFVTTLATAGTTLLSLSFVFSVTAQEVLGSCVFLFVKHPLDVGDTVYLNGTNQSLLPDQLIVEHVSLLYTVFKRVNSGRLVQIPNNILNTYWIENISRSKAMREQLALYVDFTTTFEDIQLLRTEMAKFVTDKDNARDFQPNVEIEVVGIGKMDSLELRIEIMHKSNWANESVRAARRSRFMCALVLAMRKVPIYGPSGAGPSLGEMGNPTYSVSIADDIAARKREAAAQATDAKRMVPALTSTSNNDSNATLSPTMSEQAEFSSRVDGMKTNLNNTSSAPLATIQETRAVNMLNERFPGQDTARDSGSFRADTGGAAQASIQGRRGSEVAELEEVRGILRTATTKGRRRSGTTSSNVPPVTPVTSNPPGYHWQSPSGVRRSGTTARRRAGSVTAGLSNVRTSTDNDNAGTSSSAFAVHSAPTAPYMYPSAGAGGANVIPHPPGPAAPAYSNTNTNTSQTAYYGAGGPPPPSNNIENIRPTPPVVPNLGRSQVYDEENDLRGENEEEEPLGGQPKMTAGAAASAHTWRSGV